MTNYIVMVADIEYAQSFDDYREARDVQFTYSVENGMDVTVLKMEGERVVDIEHYEGI